MSSLLSLKELVIHNLRIYILDSAQMSLKRFRLFVMILQDMSIGTRRVPEEVTERGI